jgi:DNA-binding transcriptional MerR regulator
MAKNQRTFQDGINEVNGFVVNVVRFVGAQQVSETSRIAAKHWGTITTPSGEVIDMGESGMTTPQIKRIVGGETKSYNREGSSSEIKKLEQLKSQLESLGLSTADVDAKIEEKQAEIEAESRSKENEKEIKKLEKEIKKLENAKSQLESLGLSTTEVTWKIADLNAQIENLR